MVGRMIKIVLLALLTTTAVAVAQTQDDVIHAKVLSGWRMDDGHYMAGLQLALAPDWKTYWRSPGEAGIPPVFDWSGSHNVASVQLHWPNPTVFEINGLRSIGYLNGVVLPVEITPVDPALPVDLVLQLQVGVCHDICMPANLKLAGRLEGAGARDQSITAALNDGPVTATAAGLRGIGCDLAAIDDGLHITAHMTLPELGGEETVVFETANPAVWVASAEANRSGGVLTASTDLVPPNGTAFSLDRSTVTVTVLSHGHSVEIKGCPAP